jgi:hypothetical protein
LLCRILLRGVSIKRLTCLAWLLRVVGRVLLGLLPVRARVPADSRVIAAVLRLCLLAGLSVLARLLRVVGRELLGLLPLLARLLRVVGRELLRLLPVLARRLGGSRVFPAVLRLWLLRFRLLLRIRLLLVGLVRPTGLLVVAQWIPQYLARKCRHHHAVSGERRAMGSCAHQSLGRHIRMFNTPDGGNQLAAVVGLSIDGHVVCGPAAGSAKGLVLFCPHSPILPNRTFLKD